MLSQNKTKILQFLFDINVDTNSFVVKQIYKVTILTNKNWKISSLTDNEIKKEKLISWCNESYNEQN